MKNPFLEQQQKLLDIWTDSVSKVPGMETVVEAYRNMTPDVNELWEQISEAAVNPAEYWTSFTEMPGVDAWSNLFSNPLGMGAWTDLFQAGANNPLEQWAEIMQSMANPMEYFQELASTIPGVDVYQNLMNIWQDIQNPQQFAQNFMDKYSELAQTVLQGFLPAGVAPFLAEPKDLMDSLIALYQYLFSPWMKIDNSIFQRIAAGDTKAYVDFFREFQNRYEETFQKMFNMSGMGLNREANADVMHAIDAYFQAVYATGELIALVYNTWQDSAEDLVNDYQAQLAEGKPITTFKQFYDLWFRNTEDALEKLFDTDEFAKTFGHFADVYSKYKIASDKVVERMLDSLPIPTNKDMDSLYKTVYDLRKEVRNLTKSLKEVQAGMKKSTSK